MSNSQEVVTENGSEDPFFVIGLPRDKSAVATVQMGVKRSLEVATNDWCSCEATVTLQCPQIEGSINMAGELCFTKALELVNDGLSIMAPHLAAVTSE